MAAADRTADAASDPSWTDGPSDEGVGMHSSTSRRLAVAIAACGALLTLVMGCSSSSSPGSSGGGGGATTSGSTSSHQARSLSDINIAAFYSPTNNAYVAAFNRTAASVSKQLGAKLTVFGSNDVSTQIQQIQSASTSGRYNAWIIAATDPNQECSLILNEAKKIPVLIINQGLCGHDTYTPGTVAFVGGQTSAVYKQYYDYIVKDNPSGGNVVLLTGPNLNYNTINAVNGFKAMVAAHPDFKTVADQQLDYTTATAYDATTSLLRAHPDTSILITNYSDMTVGAVRAIAQLGMTSKTRVYDLGASKQALAYVKSGGIRMSYPLLPVEEMTTAIKVMCDYWQGKPIQHVYLDTDQLKKFPGSPFIAKANVNDFTPAY
jgi:ribose transport system substrate-binding protein